jgi:PiT family inorganic phosphate transporter
VPLVVGTRVASTISDRLVTFDESDGQVAVLLAILTSLTVVAVLVRLRMPTSLTLSTIGALVGVGWGFGFPVSWATTGIVLVAGLLGPLVGAAIGLAAITALSILPARATGPRLVRGLHVAGFGAECLAYGANDGQRMLAIFALAAATTPKAEASGWLMAGIAALFAVGAAGGMYRYAGTLGTDLAPARPHDAAIAELGGSGASFAGLAIGAPLSMTQAISGGIIGSASVRGWRRIRWTRAGRLALAWVLTLPSALVIGSLAGTIAGAAS